MIAFKPREFYRNVFFSEASRALMLSGRIIGTTDTPQSVIAKLKHRLISSELDLGEAPNDTSDIIGKFERYIEDGVCVLGSPLLTNVAAERPTLASCTAVPLSSEQISYETLHIAEDYYKLNMGSGYNLDAFADPVGALVTLNQHASRLETAAICERYIGNIAHLAIDHPEVHAFVEAKTVHRGLKHFNISVDISNEFMSAVDSGQDFVLRNGERVRAHALWQTIVRNAWACGDPGLISLNRFNADNSVAATSPYTTTAPCAEVGLADGEACIFGYINLAACLYCMDSGILSLDLDLVGDVAECLTRILDNSIENSMNSFPTPASNSVMASNRKIGIGVCGFADALLWIGLDYGSNESCALLRSALSTINYRSKHASMVLAARRGKFQGFQASRYSSDPSYATRFSQFSEGVTEQDWLTLAKDIERYGLRNAMTTALPPSGRTSLLLGVNASIEPMLNKDSFIRSYPVQKLIEIGRVCVSNSDDGLEVIEPVTGASWPQAAQTTRSLFRSATVLSVAEHLSVLTAACKLVDDGVSKTVNLPSDASVHDVEAVFKYAWNAGLKAISVYRQPKIEEETAVLMAAS